MLQEVDAPPLTPEEPLPEQVSYEKSDEDTRKRHDEKEEEEATSFVSVRYCVKL